MDNWTVSQAYFMCVTEIEGDILKWDMKKAVSLIVAEIYDLYETKNININGDKFSIRENIPKDKEYMMPLFSYISQNGVNDIKKVVEHYVCSADGTEFLNIVNAMGEYLSKAREMKIKNVGFFKKKKLFIPMKSCLDDIVIKFSDIVFSNTIMSEYDVLLTTLLNEKISIESYFYYTKWPEAKEIIEKTMQFPRAKKVKEIFRYIDEKMAFSKSFLNN